jgi:transcriptional regulator with PAS, ATPase and Fis domain
MIRGPTGSGKEAFAKALHQYSVRAKQPFIAINCGAIPESLIESELFGYAPGAFTGARREGMRGKIAQSSGGTLFLDEIGDMPLLLQTRLLRALEE